MTPNEDIHLFFGHQNRTKGYIIDVFDKLSIGVGKGTIYKDGKKPRFSNGCILELKIEKLDQNNIQLTLSLAYTGDYSGNKKSKYWIGEDYKSSNDTFIPVTFDPKVITITPEKLRESFKIDSAKFDEEKQIICYFVRHGYSNHNDPGLQRAFSYTGNSLFNTNTSLKRGKIDRTRELLDSAKKTFMRGGEGEEGEEDVEGLGLGPGEEEEEEGLGPGEKDVEGEGLGPVKEEEEEEEEEVSLVGPDIEIQKKIGTEQALKSGIYFSQILGDRKLTSICVSDLIRTHQTAQYFLTGLLEFKSSALPEDLQIYVLPCFHELKNKGKDEDSKIANNVTRVFTFGQTQGLINRENNTNCRNDADFRREGSVFGKFRLSGKQRNNCDSIQVVGKVIPLNWSFYKSIYYGKYRDQFEIEFSTKRNPCINNNFLGMFLDYFYNRPLPPSGGKTRKHKKLNKKHKTNKKHKKISKKNKFIHRNTRKHKY